MWCVILDKSQDLLLEIGSNSCTGAYNETYGLGGYHNTKFLVEENKKNRKQNKVKNDLFIKKVESNFFYKISKNFFKRKFSIFIFGGFAEAFYIREYYYKRLSIFGDFLVALKNKNFSEVNKIFKSEITFFVYCKSWGLVNNKIIKYLPCTNFSLIDFFVFNYEKSISELENFENFSIVGRYQSILNFAQNFFINFLEKLEALENEFSDDNKINGRLVEIRHGLNLTANANSISRVQLQVKRNTTFHKTLKPKTIFGHKSYSKKMVLEPTSFNPSLNEPKRLLHFETMTLQANSSANVSLSRNQISISFKQIMHITFAIGYIRANDVANQRQVEIVTSYEAQYINSINEEARRTNQENLLPQAREIYKQVVSMHSFGNYLSDVIPKSKNSDRFRPLDKTQVFKYIGRLSCASTNNNLSREGFIQIANMGLRETGNFLYRFQMAEFEHSPIISSNCDGSEYNKIAVPIDTNIMDQNLHFRIKHHNPYGGYLGQIEHVHPQEFSKLVNLELWFEVNRDCLNVIKKKKMEDLIETSACLVDFFSKQEVPRLRYLDNQNNKVLVSEFNHTFKSSITNIIKCGGISIRSYKNAIYYIKENPQHCLDYVDPTNRNSTFRSAIKSLKYQLEQTEKLVKETEQELKDILDKRIIFPNKKFYFPGKD